MGTLSRCCFLPEFHPSTYLCSNTSAARVCRHVTEEEFQRETERRMMLATIANPQKRLMLHRYFEAPKPHSGNGSLAKGKGG